MSTHAQRIHILKASIFSFNFYLSADGKSPFDFPTNLDRNSQFPESGEMVFFVVFCWFVFSINETIHITQLLGHFSYSLSQH